MPEDLDLDEYWTDEQAAEYLGIKVTSVSSWAARHPAADRRMRMKASLVVAEKLASPGQGRRRKTPYWCRTMIRRRPHLTGWCCTQ